MKMKRNTLLLGGSLALFLAGTFPGFAPTLHAQTRSQYAAAQQQQPNQQKTQTFNGQIMQLKNGQFALVTGKTAQGGLAGHYLDDQNDAKKFVGKNVKVTGQLDAATNVIHVINIQAV